MQNHSGKVCVSWGVLAAPFSFLSEKKIGSICHDLPQIYLQVACAVKECPISLALIAPGSSQKPLLERPKPGQGCHGTLALLTQQHLLLNPLALWPRIFSGGHPPMSQLPLGAPSPALVATGGAVPTLDKPFTPLSAQQCGMCIARA